MSSILVTLGFLVAGLVGAAALLKAARWSEFRRELGDYGLRPKWLQAPTAVAVPLVEAAGVLAFVLPGTRQVGAGALALLLGIFAGVLVLLLAQGRSEVRCACFGHSERAITWVLPIRNLVLAFPLAAIVGLDVSVARLALSSRDRASTSRRRSSCGRGSSTSARSTTSRCTVSPAGSRATPIRLLSSRRSSVH